MLRGEVVVGYWEIPLGEFGFEMVGEGGGEANGEWEMKRTERNRMREANCCHPKGMSS